MTRRNNSYISSDDPDRVDLWASKQWMVMGYRGREAVILSEHPTKDKAECIAARYREYLDYERIVVEKMRKVRPERKPIKTSEQCLHCRRRQAANAKRGLCHRCYMVPGVRQRYPSQNSKENRDATDVL
jgi:hypothetical protein